MIPCYNEAQVIRETLRRVMATCDSLKKPYEVVCVNDGSTDGTWSGLLALSLAHPQLVLVNLSRNHGRQLALSAGLLYCRGDRGADHGRGSPGSSGTAS